MNGIIELPSEAATALKRLRPQWDLAGVGGVELLVGCYTNDNYALTYRGSDYVLRLARPSPVAVDRAFEKRLLTGPIALLTAPLVASVIFTCDPMATANGNGGGSARLSTAPTSTCARAMRLNPRWSVVNPLAFASNPASSAGLLSARAIVWVGPPLSASRGTPPPSTCTT